MKPITTELIKEHLGYQVKKRGKRWKVTLRSSGAVMTITASRMDMGKYRLLEYRKKKGIDEVALEQDMFDAMCFAKEVWGDDLAFFDTPGLTEEDESNFAEWAQENGFSLRKNSSSPFGNVKKYFGADAVAKRCSSFRFSIFWV